MAAKPPESKYEWRLWQAAVRDSFPDKVTSWLPGNIRINWPEDLRSEIGPGWIPLAEDHPFKGRHFCWRCLAEAEGFPTGGAPHSARDICWGVEQEQAGQRDAPAEDRNSFKTARVRVETGDGRIIEATAAWFQRLDKEGRPVGERQALHTPPFTEPEQWEGFPSWTDDEIADLGQGFWPPPPVETILPAEAMEPLWSSLNQAEPVQGHEADESDGQPATDEEA